MLLFEGPAFFEGSGVELEEGVAFAFVGGLDDLHHDLVGFAGLLGTRGGSFSQADGFLDEGLAEFFVGEDEEAVAGGEGGSEEGEFLHVHVAETGDFDGVGGFEDVAFDGALGVAGFAVGGGDVALGGVNPFLSRGAGVLGVEGGGSVGGGGGFLLGGVLAVAGAAGVVAGGGEADGVFVHVDAFSLRMLAMAMEKTKVRVAWARPW